LQSFIEQWESAEETLSEDDTKLLRNLNKKDRGPFLYWLINERKLGALRRINCSMALCRVGRVCALRVFCVGAIANARCPYPSLFLSQVLRSGVSLL
jgi:hypothetical protein